MKHFIFAILLTLVTWGIQAQESIQITDINLVNLGDGQTYAHRKDEAKTPITGKVRIITGVTTEYIDAEFNNQGLAIGKWEYYKNNNLRSYASYKEGYLDGEWAEVLVSGDIKQKGEYLNGKKHGTWTTYNSEGNPKETEIYNDGKVEKRTTFYTNGNIDMERNFKNGKEHGSSKTYTLDGKLKSDKNYVNGKQVGKQMIHFTSNIADYIETSNYSPEGKQDGEYTQVYVETKAVKVKGQYIKGQKTGKWVYNTIGGKPIKEETYENGVLKETRKFEN
ncbi:toxin-antitoxin system YwqK family antitoxin [Dysgonomonas macrotermitis]|uniref:Antitoxin component YwqK of the YwqJK toxin-antitoxin module n=1 Tax=Dysgonomonas macrotermitis TaxID=1346286 RepID=A0A1M5H654_9BACT|nr:hypothetical protein [Dysgonomonas macrotermitis]SHG11376.1 Antitoxin component YwqK of the YwqJK toxin-antitoxin module [Dysgonomonas macrotermitis]